MQGAPELITDNKYPDFLYFKILKPYIKVSK